MSIDKKTVFSIQDQRNHQVRDAIDKIYEDIYSAAFYNASGIPDIATKYIEGCTAEIISFATTLGMADGKNGIHCKKSIRDFALILVEKNFQTFNETLNQREVDLANF
ncbi:MAG: hypothetical protein AB8G05_22725 [Oligoflexales bacterium]